MSEDLVDSQENEDLKDDEQSHLSSLMSSVLLGDVEKATALIDKVDDVNKCDEDGYSVLHAAVCFGNLDLIGMLVDRGANLNLQSQKGLTPLHMAVKENLPKVVQLLVDRGADKSLRDKQGSTPLLQAMQLTRAYLDIVEVLTENKCTQMDSTDDKQPYSSIVVGRKCGLFGTMRPIKKCHPNDYKHPPKLSKDDKPESPEFLNKDCESETDLNPSKKSSLKINQGYFDFGRLLFKEPSSVLPNIRKSDSSSITGTLEENLEIFVSEIRPASLIPSLESPVDPGQTSINGDLMPVDSQSSAEDAENKMTPENMMTSDSSNESEDEDDVYQCLVRPIGNDYSRLNKFRSKKDPEYSNAGLYEKIVRLGVNEQSTFKLCTEEDEKKHDESEYISNTGFQVMLRHVSGLDKVHPIVLDKPVSESAENASGQRESIETEDNSKDGVDDLQVAEITEDCLASNLIDLSVYEKLIHRKSVGDHYVKIINIGTKDGDKSRSNVRVVDRLKNKFMLFKISEDSLLNSCDELVSLDKNKRCRSPKNLRKFHSDDEIRKYKSVKANEGRGKKSEKDKKLSISGENCSISRLCYLDDDDDNWDHYSKPRKFAQRKSNRKFWTCRRLFRSNSRH